VTGIERTLKALSFEVVDRSPMAGGLLQNAEFLAHKAGRADFWSAARDTVFEAFRRLGCDAILGPVMPKRPEETTVDSSGKATSFRQVSARPQLTTPEQVAAYADSVPGPEQVREDFDAPQAVEDYAAMMAAGQADAGDMLYIPHCLGYAPFFPTSDGHFAYEAFLMACALYPGRVSRLFVNWGEQARVRFETVAQTTLEQDLLRLIWIGQDLCDAKGPVMSPAAFRRLYFPILEYAVEPLKQADIRIVWHADANYRELVPDLLALGVDGFQGLYETQDGTRLEDLARVRTTRGAPPIIFGSVSTVWVLPSGTSEDVRREVARCVDAVGSQGGLLLAPSSSIGPEVPPENIEAMYEYAR